MIASSQALAVRRFLLTALGLAATLLAHAVCAGGLSITLAAPTIWGSLGCLAVVAGPRRYPRWREWSAPGLVARLVAVEMGLHLLLTAMPWSLGIHVHHAPALIGPRMLVAHLVAALLLALVLGVAQRLLSLAQGLVQAVRRALRIAGGAAAPRLGLSPRDHSVPPVLHLRPRGARGPPALAM